MKCFSTAHGVTYYQNWSHIWDHSSKAVKVTKEANKLLIAVIVTEVAVAPVTTIMVMAVVVGVSSFASRFCAAQSFPLSLLSYFPIK